MSLSIHAAIQEGRDALHEAGIADSRREAGSLLVSVLNRDQIFETNVNSLMRSGLRPGADGARTSRETLTGYSHPASTLSFGVSARRSGDSNFEFQQKKIAHATCLC